MALNPAGCLAVRAAGGGVMTPRTRRLLIANVVGTLTGVVIAAAVLAIRHSLNHPPSDLHELLHEAVPLEANEKKILEAKELEFGDRRREIEKRLRVANGQLAQAIARNPSWSPEVEAAIQQVERAAGDLQRATLVHAFEMRAGLKPEHRAAYDAVLVDALQRGSQ